MNDQPLYEFISHNRQEILQHCLEKMDEPPGEPERRALGKGLSMLLDEIVRALQCDAGLPVRSPLPEASPTAKWHGGVRQQHGYPIEKLALDLGGISDAVGAVGARQGRVFAAREYQVFNQCIDRAVSEAIEQFDEQAREQQAAEATRRLGSLAHELRNALSSARMAFAALKQGQVIGGRTGEVLDRSLARLEGLVHQVLLSTRLEAMPLEPRPLPVRDLLREVVDTAVPERDIRIAVEVDEALALDADPRLMVSALSNLLQNAFKFTRRGGLVTLRSHAEGSRAVIEVEDECGGLPPGHHEELFAPYVQRGGTGRGLGLGLTITREAIEAQGGTLSVRDLPGRGCVFSVTMPRAAST